MKKILTRIVPIIVLLSFLSFVNGCGMRASINEPARKEAESLERDATAQLEKAHKSVSLENKYSWDGVISVNDAATRKEKFANAASELEKARDQFTAASAKYSEALNGQKAFDNKDATYISRMSTAMKSWSDLTEFERKTFADTASVNDSNKLIPTLTEASTSYKKRYDELMSLMRATRN